MENASKALIIAGAILLSILIIALGVFVFNQAKSAVGNTGLSDQEVAAFNSKFDSYEGKQKGSSVKALVNTVKNYNNTVDTTNSEYINVQSGNATAGSTVEFISAVPNYPTNIKSGTMYSISFAYNKAGQISCIYYKEQ